MLKRVGEAETELNLGIELENNETAEIFVANIGETANRFAQNFVFQLRRDGIRAERDYMERSVKAQMKYAGKIGAQYTLVLGEDELAKGIYPLKNMQTGEITEIPADDFVDKMVEIALLGDELDMNALLGLEE